VADDLSFRMNGRGQTWKSSSRNGLWLGSSIAKLGRTCFSNASITIITNTHDRAHTKTFILCANSTNSDSVVSPSEAKYITSNGTRVCSLYQYNPPLSFYHFFSHQLTEPHYRSLNDAGQLKGLIAVDKLKQPQYNITARDMVQSSVEAYLASGLNYTAEEVASRLQISATLPSDQQWFSQGAAGEGAFTIPVCDVGDNTEWMGSAMPCCCGKFSLFLPSFLPSLLD